MLIFSNLGFMGIPIIEELYGRGAIFYVALYTLVYNILFYTYGIYLFEGVKNSMDAIRFGRIELLKNN